VNIVQLDNVGPDPLELLTESCKRICPASVKPLSTDPHTSSSATSTSTSSGSKNARCVEQRGAPTIVNGGTADYCANDDEGQN